MLYTYPSIIHYLSKIAREKFIFNRRNLRLQSHSTSSKLRPLSTISLLLFQHNEGAILQPYSLFPFPCLWDNEQQSHSQQHDPRAIGPPFLLLLTHHLSQSNQKQTCLVFTIARSSRITVSSFLPILIDIILIKLGLSFITSKPL